MEAVYYIEYAVGDIVTDFSENSQEAYQALADQYPDGHLDIGQAIEFLRKFKVCSALASKLLVRSIKAYL